MSEWTEGSLSSIQKHATHKKQDLRDDEEGKRREKKTFYVQSATIKMFEKKNKNIYNKISNGEQNALSNFVNHFYKSL